MKYKIILGGRGAEIFVHEISDKQKSKLAKLADEDNFQIQASTEDIAKILDVSDLDQVDISFTGIYDEAGNVAIEVYDSKDKPVFDSLKASKKWYFDEDTRMEHDNYECHYEAGNYMFVENFGKGAYLEFELEAKSFDPKKLSPVQSEINERFILITGLCYDGKRLEYSFGDYSGKGTYYYLSAE